MLETKGLIFDIQSYSVHDGPGCRTSVFMTGCPLRCLWCANPEGREFKQKLLYRSSKCVNAAYGCVRCMEACPRQAIELNPAGESPLKINRELCKQCSTFECSENCFYEALVICGKWYKTSELMSILNRDRQYWGSNGGVTFTGGEPLRQKEFLSAILKECRESYIHTAIETCCHCETNSFLEIMNYIDFAFLDIKHMDGARHKDYTGFDNELILKNIRNLVENNWPGKAVIRLPIIEGFNDDRENILKTAEFLSHLNLKEVNILSFNPLGESKWRQCGLEYLYKDHRKTSDRVLSEIGTLFLEKNIFCYIDYNTPW